MQVPTCIDDLKKLVSAEVRESIHLEYKQSDALINKRAHSELSKDVSSFANSDGGLIVYGIVEKDNIPVAIDSGVPNNQVSREWVEQVINSNIAPRIEGIEIKQIPIDSANSAYCISIPKSYRAPHQDRYSKRYYKRHNFSANPMEDYEVGDVRARSATIEQLVSFDVEIRHGTLFMLKIENPGSIPAEDVSFEFSEKLTWYKDEEPPPIINNGIEYFPPGKRYTIFYGRTMDLLKDGAEKCNEFTVFISYSHPLRKGRVSETFHINLKDYLGTWPSYSEIDELSKKIEKSSRDMTGEIRNLNRHLEKLEKAIGLTGLNLSATTLKSIANIMKGDFTLEKLNPIGQPGPFFEEVLGVEQDIAWKIAEHFWRSNSINGLQDIEDITPEVIDVIKQRLRVIDKEKDA